MLFPSSTISQMQQISNASMQDAVRIYTAGQAAGFGEAVGADTNHYNGDGHVEDGKAAVLRESGGDAEIDADAVVRVPLTATGYDQDNVRLEATYGATGYTVTRTGHIEGANRGRTAIRLFVKWTEL